jgi:hypothetical protein
MESLEIINENIPTIPGNEAPAQGAFSFDTYPQEMVVAPRFFCLRYFLPVCNPGRGQLRIAGDLCAILTEARNMPSWPPHHASRCLYRWRYWNAPCGWAAKY